jgi:hypothetical protein
VEPDRHEALVVGSRPVSDEASLTPSKHKAIITVGVAVVVAVIVFGVSFPQRVDWSSVFEIMRQVGTFDLVVIFALGVLRYVPAGWIYAARAARTLAPEGHAGTCHDNWRRVHAPRMLADRLAPSRLDGPMARSGRWRTGRQADPTQSQRRYTRR